MATTYISKISPINDPNYTEYIIKDAEAVASISTGDSNGQIKITLRDGITTYPVNVKGLGSNAYTSTAYLPLAGGTMTGAITFVGNQSSAYNDKGILFTNGSRIGENSANALGLYSGEKIYLRPGCTNGSSGEGIEISTSALYPTKNNEETLGAADHYWLSAYATTFYGALSGNASTATKFAAAQSIALTGDVTGSASSQAGWSIATTLANSGVTAGNYGQSTNGSPNHGGTFSVPYFTVDAKGRITSASTKTITLPSDNNTDTLVTQTNQASTNADYRILLSGSANDTTATETANKNTNLRFNPSTQTLSIGGNVTASGNLSVTGTSTLSGETSAQSLTAGSLLVTGNASFTQIPTAPTPATGSNDTSVATTAFVKNNLGGLSGAMHFKGTTTTTMSDGLTTAAVTIGGSSYTPEAGDVVLYSDSEFVWTGSAWERLGRDSSFKVTQTAVTDVAYTGSDTATTFVSAVTQDSNGNIEVTKRKLPTYNNYSHPTTTAVDAAAVKVGKDNLGHVVLGSALTNTDVGLGNVENTKLSTWAGSSNITTIGTLSSGTVPWARLSNVPSSFAPSAHTHYWANVETTSAAAYNTAPEMATLKLNGNTSASAASTSNVTLVFDATLQTLNFVFA